MTWTKQKIYCYISSYHYQQPGSIFVENMECIFCDQTIFLINRYYCFLQGIQINKLKYANVDPQNMYFELYTKYMEKVHRLNCIPIQSCVTELICSLASDRSGRYTGL